MFDRVIKEGGVYHIWGHGWEIDDHNDWERWRRRYPHQSGVLSRINALTSLAVASSSRGSQVVILRIGWSYLLCEGTRNGISLVANQAVLGGRGWVSLAAAGLVKCQLARRIDRVCG